MLGRGPSRAAGSRLLTALLFAAGAFGCRGRSRHVVHLPLPRAEWLAVESETRPGCWLSPGDSVEWDLPPGPSRRLEAAYASSLAGAPPGSLEATVAPRPGTPVSRLLVPISPDAAHWGRWSMNLPGNGAPVLLRIAYRSRAPGFETRSLFLTEPTFSVRHSEPPRTIVLFLIDTLRADHVSGYGYRRPTTPRLDRFFRDGLRAQTCLPTANWTLPSHASLLTSTSVARHGVARYGQLLPEELETLAGTIARAGYRTVAVTGGAFVDPVFGFGRGFDRYAVVPGPAALAVRSALAMLEEHEAEPVFLFFHTYQLHDYAPDEPAARALFPDLSALGPGWSEGLSAFRKGRGQDPRSGRWFRARYDAALRSVDTAFGRLLEGLQRLGRLEQTAVLFTSDHGESLCERTIGADCLGWGHGSPYLFEGELRVPLEVRVPWMPGRRGTVEGDSSLLDVAPTLAAAAGSPVPSSFEGRSLLSGASRPDRVLVTEAPPLDALAVREGSFKLIRRTGAPQTSWVDGAAFHLLPAEECFDLERDPEETRPVPCAGSSARLRREVERYLVSSFPDSLLLRVPASAGGQVLREAVVRARGRGRPPAVRTFGIPSGNGLQQSGAAAWVRFRPGPSPVWIGFEPADGSHALEIEVSGLEAPVSAAGNRLGPGTYDWAELAWRSGAALPAGVTVLTTPPSRRSASSAPPLPSDVLARLLALGYLRVAPLPGASSPPASEGTDGAATLSAGEVRVLLAD